VAETAEKVVGFATAQIQSPICYDGSWAELVEVYVQPDSRKRGVARSLIEGIEEALKSKGVASLFLRTNRTNAAAQALYQACGLEMMSEVVFEKSLEEDK